MKAFLNYAVWGLGLVLAACTAAVDDMLDGDDPGNNGGISGDRRQIEMLVRNELVPGNAATKADESIALSSENEVTAMDVYVFASETEYGVYTFQERLTYRAGQEEVAPEGATPFVLVTDDTDNRLSKASLPIKKGMFVKIYCVANAPDLYVLDETEKVYKPVEFTPLTMEKVDGQMKLVTPGIPTEKEFLEEYTVHSIDPKNPQDIISTPLLMRGNVTGWVDLTDYNNNARISTSIKLVRGVARFDVNNVATKSKLTITGIGMTNGNATTALFPFDARPAADGSLITYPWKFFPEGANAAINKGTQLGAFYSYAAPKEACLVLQGDYKTSGNETMQVNYTIPFNSLKDGEGNQISIEPNHRYTVTVHEADPYEVKLTIKVADWEEGGSLDDFETDNEDAGGMSDLTTAAVLGVSGVSDVYDNGSYFLISTYANVAGDKFSVTLSSNSEIECKMKFGEGDTTHKWLDVRTAQTKAMTKATWSNEYKFTFSVSSQTAGSNDKAFPQVLINFISAGGVTHTIKVESRTYSLDGKTAVNALPWGDGGNKEEYWYFDKGSGTWDQAMQACPEEQGWYLVTMNDFRNLFRIDNWSTVELPFNTTPYLNLYNQTNERGVNNTYLTRFYPGTYTYPGYPSQSCSSYYYGDSNYSYYDSNYDYFWSGDMIDANQARSIKLRARTYAYRRCTRSCQSYDDDWRCLSYRYYTTTGRGHNSSYLTYEKTSRTATRKIRCVKRLPGHPTYPY